VYRYQEGILTAVGEPLCWVEGVATKLVRHRLVHAPVAPVGKVRQGQCVGARLPVLFGAQLHSEGEGDEGDHNARNRAKHLCVAVAMADGIQGHT